MRGMSFVSVIHALKFNARKTAADQVRIHRILDSGGFSLDDSVADFSRKSPGVSLFDVLNSR